VMLLLDRKKTVSFVYPDAPWGSITRQRIAHQCWPSRGRGTAPARRTAAARGSRVVFLRTISNVLALVLASSCAHRAPRRPPPQVPTRPSSPSPSTSCPQSSACARPAGACAATRLRSSALPGRIHSQRRLCGPTFTSTAANYDKGTSSGPPHPDTRAITTDAALRRLPAWLADVRL